MFIHKRNPLAPQEGTETPEAVALNRRKFLRKAGIYAALAAGLAGGGLYLRHLYLGGEQEILSAGELPSKWKRDANQFFPARPDERFEYGRPETEEVAAARWTNFFEFSSTKQVWRFIHDFDPDPWTVTVRGMCRKPQKFDVAELMKKYAKHLCERQYRHRCVETWAMAIPWTGFPLAALLKEVEPLPQATHVRFVSFNRPEVAGNQARPEFPWPYMEGLTLPEAMNELTFLATGMYGHPLLKQHGAPIRLVVPWKYGYKSIKSIERIELTDREPETFWTSLQPNEYPFQSNVNPNVPHPRWSQATEWMLGTQARHPTQLYNGYEEYVAKLYK